MGAILDPGSSTVAVEEELDLPGLGVSPWLVGSCGVALTILSIVALSEGDPILGLGAGFVFCVLAFLILVRVIRREVTKTMHEAAPRRGPVDQVRSSLDFSPVDGRDMRVGRLGGGGTLRTSYRLPTR